MRSLGWFHEGEGLNGPNRASRRRATAEWPRQNVVASMQRMGSPLAAELKRYLSWMVVAVIAVDAVAIGLYYALRVRSAPPRTQALFTGAWMVLTLVVVLTGLTRIRAARVRWRRSRS